MYLALTPFTFLSESKNPGNFLLNARTISVALVVSWMSNTSDALKW